MENDFKQYRLQKDYSLKTIRSQDCYIRKFTGWLKEKAIGLQSITYPLLLSFVCDERKKGSSAENLKNQLQSIRLYLNYQKEKGMIEHNPAERIKIRDRIKKAMLPPLEEDTLLNVYKAFTEKQYTISRRRLEQQRDTVALGLMIFQGLDSGEMERLSVQDINLRQGTVYVPASRRNAARTLKLESLQILSIHEYVNCTRSRLNEKQVRTDKLFIKQKINDMVSAIVQKIKAEYPEIRHPRHIRQSVIMNRLTKHHIREVQYMSGHRSVSSTERYRQEDLHDLAQQLSRYHPLK